MALEWYLMNSSHLSGLEEDDFNVDKGGFSELTASFIGTDIQIYGDCITNTPVPKRAIIQGVTRGSVELSDERKILCAIGTLACGQYIKFNNQWWLVASMPSNNLVYEKAVLWYCQYPLKFINPGTAIIVEYPIPTESATNGSGEKSTRYITLGATERVIYLPYNAVTAKINNGYRFLIDRRSTDVKAYKVTNVDTTSFMWGSIGLIRLVCEEDPLRSTDNVSTKVADNTSLSAGGDTEGEVWT